MPEETKAEAAQTKASSSQSAGAGQQAAAKEDEALTARINAAVARAQGPLQRQLAARERELQELREERDAVLEYRDDPAKLQEWQNKRIAQRARDEERAQLLQERLEMARERAMARGMPDAMVNSIEDPDALRHMVTAWEAGRQAAGAGQPARVEAAAEAEPKAPPIVTAGAAGAGAATLPPEEFLRRQANLETRDNSPAALAKEIEIANSLGYGLNTIMR